MDLSETANLADYFLFARLGEGLGERTALRYGERRYSYDDVARRARQFAARLAVRGNEVIPAPGNDGVWREFQNAIRQRIAAMVVEKQPAIESFFSQCGLHVGEVHNIYSKNGRSFSSAGFGVA